MKTFSSKKLPPPPPLEVEELPPLPRSDGHSLKAYFCGQALAGCLASQEESYPIHEDQALVERAYALGEAMFSLYVEENLSAVGKFNRKVGL